jgi:ribosomal protein S8
MVKKLKNIIKVNPEPVRGRFGVNPSDPWSAKANIAEGVGGLDNYLLSRGIDPKRLSRDTKISHAKTTAYIKWKKDHTFEEVEQEESEIIAEDKFLDKFLSSRGINPNFATKQMKIAHAKSGEFIKWKRDHMFESITTQHTPTEQRLHALKRAEPMHKEIPSNGLKQKQTALEKFRAASAERQRKHDEIAKKPVGMTNAIDRLQSHMNREEVELDQQINEVLSKDASAGDWIHDFIHSDNPKFAGKSKKERQKMALGAYYAKQNEEVEQIDEISKPTLTSYREKSMASLKNAKVNRAAAEPGKDMSKGFADLHAKSDAIAKKRAKGLSGYLQRKHGMKPGYSDERKPTSENTLDSLAATEAPGNCVNSSDGVSIKKKEMSKSARMIKALYKKFNMKEETYDWEKDDKHQTSYGKKPKITKDDEKKNYGENKPQARAVLSGGTTLTGEKRDTVEIDPMMKNRPDLNGNKKND